MTDSYRLIKGTKPILVSIPHNGSEIPEDIAAKMNVSALSSVDTDWYLDRLYQFAIEAGYSVLVPKYSRYVVDLNRPENDENLYPGSDTTGLCPINQFDFSPVYKVGMEPERDEISRRIALYWHPYHSALRAELEKLSEKFGFALLFEAHSIKSEVPRFFEGKLADFNFGNNNGDSCGKYLLELIKNWSQDPYSKVINGRFKGGYITRAYGGKGRKVESLQLELSQATYMDEKTLSYNEELAAQVIPKLNSMCQIFEEYCQIKIRELNAAS